MICILAGHFNFFCNKDKDWCLKTLVPFLIGDRKPYFVNAWEGIVYFSRRISKDTADIVAPIYLKALKHIQWLEGEAENGFIELLITLLINVIDKPTLKYIPEYYKNASIQNRKKLISYIKQRLINMEPENKIKWWNQWLNHFIDNRKKNIPCKAEDEEIQTIFELLPDLAEVFDEAVEVICKGKISTKVDSVFWYKLNKNGLANEHSNSMVKLLIKMLGAISISSYENKEIVEIVRSLRNIEEKDKGQLRELLLKRGIDVQII